MSEKKKGGSGSGSGSGGGKKKDNSNNGSGGGSDKKQKQKLANALDDLQRWAAPPDTLITRAPACRVLNTCRVLKNCLACPRSRFILNAPPEDQQSFERIFFHIEEAWWFYEDNYREKDKSLPGFNLRSFSEKLFSICPLLKAHHKKFDEIFAKWNEYRWSVPVCGCIMLNQELDHVLLVKGWSKHSNWAFPKGKISIGETQMPCAVREVYEETDFDCGPYVHEDCFIDKKHDEKQEVRLYIAAGVPMDYAFAPRTKKEISAIEWVRIKDLTNPKRKDGAPKPTVDPAKTYMVLPFLSDLKAWIKSLKASGDDQHTRAAAQGTGVMDVSALERQMSGGKKVSGAFDLSALEGNTVRSGAFDLSAIERGGAPPPPPPVLAPPVFAGAFDLSAIEGSQPVAASAPAPAPSAVFSGAFDLSAIEGGGPGPAATPSRKAGAFNASDLEGMPSSTVAGVFDASAMEEGALAEGASLAGRGSGGGHEPAMEPAMEPAAVVGSGGANGSERKPRRRGGKKHRKKENDRPIVTCGQMGGGASAAYSGGSSGGSGYDGLNWQQKQQQATNPFLQFRLDSQHILKDVLV